MTSENNQSQNQVSVGNYISAPPAFEPSNAKLSFLRLERHFADLNISDSLKKFNTAVNLIPVHSFPILLENIFKEGPTKDDPYNYLKEKILHTSRPTNNLWNTILTLPPIGNQLPSKYLDFLKAKLGDEIPPNDDFLKKFFTSKLPQEIQMILAIGDYPNIELLAEAADKIVEAGQMSQAQSQIHKVDFAEHNYKSNTHNALSEIKDAIQKLDTNLKSRISDLERRISDVELRSRQRYRSESNFKQGYGRDKSPYHYSNSLCYYHARFKNTATKCVKPCSWKPRANQKSQALNE